MLVCMTLRIYYEFCHVTFEKKRQSRQHICFGESNDIVERLPKLLVIASLLYVQKNMKHYAEILKGLEKFLIKDTTFLYPRKQILLIQANFSRSIQAQDT